MRGNWHHINSPKWNFIPGNQNDNELRGSQALFAIILILTAVGCLVFINNELWQDELYTLKHFVLVPVQKTVTDYHSTNNHVVFSLIENMYLKAIGVRELSSILDRPYIARLVPFLFTILSVVVLYVGLKKNTGTKLAITSTIIYASSLQVFTFSCQVRGYSLDLLLCILLFVSIINYYSSKRFGQLITATTSSLLLLINLPSAVYLHLSIILVFLIHVIYFLKRGDNTFIGKDIKLIAALSMAFLLFVAFYYFKKEQLDQNILLQQRENDFLQLVRQPFIVAFRFFDYRIYLLALPILFIFGFRGERLQLSLLLLGCLVLPFIFYLVNRPPIILRIWIILLPVFSIFMAQACSAWVRTNNHLFLFAALLTATTLSSLLVLKKQSLSNHTHNLAPLDLRFQYHLFGFNPSEVTQIAKNYQGQIVLSDSKLAGIEYYFSTIGHVNINENIFRSSPEYLLIADDSHSLAANGIDRSAVADSGHNNPIRFYKWYKIKRQVR